MPSDYTRIHRLLRVLTLLQTGDCWTADKLAAECGVARRTIFRDLKDIEGAGVPYFFDDERKTYRVRNDFFMPPVQLTLDESLALTALAEHIGKAEQVPFMSAAGRAIEKVRSLLPPTLRDELAKLDDRVSIKLAASVPPEGMEDVYSKVRRAIGQRVALRCTYESASGAKSKPSKSSKPFTLKPYALLFSQRAWYVVGHHSSHDAVRSLKLNRFTQIDLTTTHYEAPKSFTVDKHLGLAWRMIRGDERHEIELRFDAGFADTVSDTHWHSTQDVEHHDDGSITFRCTVDGLDEIVWWILGMGPACKVLKPTTLADRVKQLADGIVGNYAEGT